MYLIASNKALVIDKLDTCMVKYIHKVYLIKFKACKELSLVLVKIDFFKGTYLKENFSH